MQLQEGAEGGAGDVPGDEGMRGEAKARQGTARRRACRATGRQQVVGHAGGGGPRAAFSGLPATPARRRTAPRARARRLQDALSSATNKTVTEVERDGTKFIEYDIDSPVGALFFCLPWSAVPCWPCLPTCKNPPDPWLRRPL